MQQFQKLFSAIKLGSLALSNRFVIPPMTSNLAHEDGTVSQARELGFDGPIYAPAFVGDINLLNGMLEPTSAHDIFQGGPDVLSPKMKPSFNTHKVVDTWEKMQSIDSIYGKARMGGQRIIGINHMVMIRP